MHLSDGTVGRQPFAFLPEVATGTSQPAIIQANVSGSIRCLSSRTLPPGLRCSGRVVLAARAASLGLRFGLAARSAAPILSSSSASAAFSTEASNIPKPGFAPGAPPPPGQPPAASPPGKPPSPSTGPPTKPSSSAPRGLPPGASSGPPPRLFPDPVPGAGGKSRWSALGWAIPIIGLPLLAALYTYKQEADKEWDQKIVQYVQEVTSMRQKMQQQKQAQQQQQQTSPAPVAKLEPPVPAPLPANAPVEPVAPNPAHEAPAAPVPPSAPKEGPGATDAAAVILVATEAGSEAAATADVVQAAGAVTAAATAAATAETDSPPPVVAVTKVTEAVEAAVLPAPAAAPVPPVPPVQPAAAPLPPAVIADAAQAAALVLLQTGAVPSDPLPPGLPEGKLGLDGRDLSPMGLVRHAVTSAGASVSDWSQWPERYAQAVADSKLAFKAVSEAAKWHEAKLAEVQSLLDAERARASQLEAAGVAAVARFKELLRQYQASTKEMIEIEVRQAEKRVRVEVEQARVAEARQRGDALDRLRLAFSALGLAHEARVRAAAAAQGGHAVAAGAAAVAAAAESGAPLAGAAAALGGMAAADPLVGAVVAALPKEAVPTRSELLQHFRVLRRDLSALSYLPGQQAGLVAVAVARLAARLKVDESEAVKVLAAEAAGAGGGIDSALARTEALLTEGKAAAAAELLAAAVDGTAAAALAKDWVAAARRRAAAEAAVTALNARAAATWASLSR